MVIKRFDIFLIQLDPTIGSEIKKTRPCVIVSPDEMNGLNTVLITPMTTKGFAAHIWGQVLQNNTQAF